MRTYFDVIEEKTNNIVCVLMGCLLFSISVNCFTAPNLISPGGIVGIGQIISDFTGMPSGILCILLNVPIFVCGAIKFGIKSVFKNVFVALTMYISIDATAKIMPAYMGSELMASILAGIIGGTGLALIFITGRSTAGTGLLSVIINDYIPNVKIGDIILFLDGVIVLMSALVYGIKDKNFVLIGSKAIYAIILLCIQARLINEISKVKNKSLKIKNIIFVVRQISKDMLRGTKGNIKEKIKVTLLRSEKIKRDNSGTILIEKI